MADAGNTPSETKPAEAPFPESEIKRYIYQNMVAVQTSGVPEFLEISSSLEQLHNDIPADLEALEQRLSALEQKLIALARIRQSEEQAIAAKRDLDGYLRPYRGKMTAPQLAMLETQFLDRAVLQAFQLPRLSLFHLR
jgi:hypothetical protein